MGSKWGANRPRRRIGTGWRCLAVAAAVFPIALLAVAGTLRPSGSGLGTHQQLGLPPCSVRMLFGIRCPACGMTTSWSHFARGEWAGSLAANAGGFLLACYAVLFSGVAARAGLTADAPSPRVFRRMTVGVVLVAAVTVAFWGWAVWFASR